MAKIKDEASAEELEGWQAFLQNVSRSTNPYPSGSEAAQDWRFGWDRAWRYWNGED